MSLGLWALSIWAIGIPAGFCLLALVYPTWLRRSLARARRKPAGTTPCQVTMLSRPQPRTTRPAAR
jgi:hypothetical protein